MATTFPTTLDSYATLTDNTDGIVAAHPNDRGDGLESAQAKIGVDSSAVTTSHDYKLTHLPAQAQNLDIGSYELRAETFESDVATGTAPLTIASTTPVDNLGIYFDHATIASQVRGDVLYMGASVWSRLAKGTSGQVLTMGANDPAWATKLTTYDSGWFAVANNTEYVKTHNLGTTSLLITILWSASATGATNIQRITATFQHEGGTWSMGAIVEDITTTTLQINTGDASVVNTAANGNSWATKTTNGYYKVLALALA